MSKRRSPEVRKSESPEESLESKGDSPKPDEENDSAPLMAEPISDTINSAIGIPNSPLKNNSEINQIASESVPEIEQEFTVHNSLLTNMEVHHHPQLEHKPKPWKEYLLEGLMIFLAVTMGFFAESLREHIADKDKENQYMQSLAEDIRGDIKAFDQQIKEEKRNLVMLDSLIAILDNPAAIPTHGDDLYYFGRLGPRQKNLTVNFRTFEQLKNSGNFRLISSIGLSNRIMSYYEKVTYIRQIEELFAQEFTGYKELAARVFEPEIFKRQEGAKGDIIKSNDNPALQKDAPQFTRQLAVYGVYINGSRGGIIAANEELLQGAKELLEYLQKEYDIKDE